MAIDLQSRIDWDFIKKEEGGLWTKGYVPLVGWYDGTYPIHERPKPHEGEGVTVCGTDLGKLTPDIFAEIPFSQALKDKLTPFIGLTGRAASASLASTSGLELTRLEEEEFVAQSKIEDGAIKKSAAAHKPKDARRGYVRVKVGSFDGTRPVERWEFPDRSSGVTIGVGVDLGALGSGKDQKPEDSEFERLKIPVELKQKLRPYVGRQSDSLSVLRSTGGVRIREDEAKAITDARQQQLLEQFHRIYENERSKHQNTVPFTALPKDVSTGIFSFAYQHGNSFGKSKDQKLSEFWSTITKQDWKAAAQRLESFDKDRARRLKEAEKLKKGITSDVGNAEASGLENDTPDTSSATRDIKQPFTAPEILPTSIHTIELLARKNGVPEEAILNHESNSWLKDLQRTASVLGASDDIVIPLRRVRTIERPVQARHRVVVKRPPRRLHVRFLRGDEPIKNARYTIQFDGGSTKDGTTDTEGFIDQRIPPFSQIASVQFTIEGEPLTFNLKVGALQPVSEREGIIQRLMNLGFVAFTEAIDWVADIQPALRAFQRTAGIAETGDPDADTESALVRLNGQ